jgi:hypothetical protein
MADTFATLITKLHTYVVFVPDVLSSLPYKLADVVPT